MGFDPAYDAHIHMALDGIDWKAAIARCKPVPDEDAVRAVLRSYAEAGIGYLRDGGDRFGACDLAASLAGEYGIEYASPGAPLCQKGNYGSFIGRTFEDIAEFCALVDELAAQGVSFIKIMTTGILDFNEYGVLTGYALPAGLLAEMVAYAHGKGFSVMSHTNGAQAVMDALEAGVDSIEHGFYLDSDAEAALARSDAIWVPTFAPICNLRGTGRFPDEVLERIAADHAKSVCEVARLGGTIACGSDAGAACVRHAVAAFDECACLSDALGTQCDSVLARGLEVLRDRFAASR